MSRATFRSQRFRCESHTIATDVARVWLSGEIDGSDFAEIDEAFTEAQADAALTILDLRGLLTTDSVVLRLAASADVRSREQGRRLVILGRQGATGASKFRDLGLDARIVTFAEPSAPVPDRLQDADAPDGDAFEVAVGASSDHALIKVFGEIDLATGPELAAALETQAARRRSIVLDLRGVEFMDSAGIHLLIDGAERARGEGLGFQLITSNAVDHTLQSAHLSEHFARLGPFDASRTSATLNSA